MDNELIWQSELQDLASRAGVGVPPFRFIDKRDVSFFSGYSLLRRGHNACASRKGITVTSDLIDVVASARSYYLAHELAHIVRDHPKQTTRNGFIYLSLCFALLIVVSLGHGLYSSIAILLLSSFSVVYIWYSSRELEFEADELAVALIGKEVAIEGCTEAGRISGTMNRTRRTRINRMKQLPDNK